MARTLIWNTSASAQTLPAGYGGGSVAAGYGWVVSDESSVVVDALGGFEAMHGKWAVAAISSDEALGSVDIGAGGVALIENVVSLIGGGGGGGGGGGVSSWNDLTDKPTFATVATSGSYADLSNKPTLADVATSGAYADLTGKPTIPSASNTMPEDVGATGAAGVLNTYARGDHAHAHGNHAGGTLHSAATTIAAGFMSAADKAKLDGLAGVATSGAYSDLSGVPSLASVATSGDYADLTGKPSLFSGAYADLSGKPALVAVATSGLASDVADLPYDMAVNSPGTHAAGAVLMRMLAPRALVLASLAQGGDAVVKITVNGVDAVYPQAVAQGDLLRAVVTTGGAENYFTLTAKVA